MSYEEVERGLPPIHPGLRNNWTDPRNLPVTTILPTWALITPSGTTELPVPPRSPTVSLIPIPKPRSHQFQTAELFKKRPVPPPPTKRYLIQDGDDNTMKVIQLEPDDSLPGTLELPRSSKPHGKRSGNMSTSQTIPKVRVTNCQSVCSVSPSTTAIIRRARLFIIILLTLLPPLFFTVAVQYFKQHLVKYGIGLKGICIFQAIFWPSVIFLLFNIIWLKLNICGGIRNGWKELIALLLLSPGAVILQGISLMYLDITVALALTFAPLVIASFLNNISQERSFPLELCVTSVMDYFGVTLIGLSIFPLTFKKDQDLFIFGFSASIGSMLLTIPSCLLLQRLRRRSVDDSVTAVAFALGGTGISSSIFVFTELNFLDKTELDPGKLSSLITFIFFGTIFQFIESKINRNSGSEVMDSNVTLRKNTPGYLRLSKTRLGIFLIVSLWELIKLIQNSSQPYFPSPLSIFGILFLVLGYSLTLGYEAWLRSVKQSNHNDVSKIRRNRCLFLPWLFSRKD